jgi:hypothetical protein
VELAALGHFMLDQVGGEPLVGLSVSGCSSSGVSISATDIKEVATAFHK